MSLPDLHDAALVLLAHGSTKNAESATPTFQQGDRLRSRGIFAEVTEAFWKQEPFVAGVLRRVFAPRVFLLPVCIAGGWFTERVLPLALGLREPGAGTYPRIQSRGAQTLFYCEPVGSHPAMTGVLQARAREIVARHPFPRAPRPTETALLIAGHGTAYSRGSRDAIEAQVHRLREMDAYAEVHAVFLEEAPFVADAWKLTTARNLVVVPYFISDGLHVAEDIPVMLGAPTVAVRERLRAGQPPWRNPTAREGRRLWLAGAVGSEPLVADVILERVREAAGQISSGGPTG